MPATRFTVGGERRDQAAQRWEYPPKSVIIVRKSAVSRVLKVVFLAGIDETGGPVTGNINVLRTVRRCRKSGIFHFMSRNVKNVNHSQNPRVYRG